MIERSRQPFSKFVLAFAQMQEQLAFRDLFSQRSLAYNRLHRPIPNGRHVLLRPARRVISVTLSATMNAE